MGKATKGAGPKPRSLLVSRTGSPLRNHPLLGLQREVGNRAAVAIVQRKLAYGAEHIDAVRSRTGELKGFLKNDTLSQLRSVLSEYQNSFSPGLALPRLAVILGLCDHYLARHKGDTNPRDVRKRDAVDDVMQSALVEYGQLQAHARYARDVYSKKTDPDVSPTRMNQTAGVTYPQVTSGAKAVVSGQPAKDGTLGADKEAIALARKYGLTEAEILAVKAYTGQDYYYINPATANDKGRMVENMKPKDDTQTRELFEEGSLHGAMTISAISKLPPRKGVAYRGERATLERLALVDAPGKSQMKTHLTSVSLSEAKAREYANGGSKTRPDETISILWEIKVVEGRDIQPLSIYGKGEGEWLLMPGAKIVTDRVVESTKGPKGTVQATRWLRIYAHQEP